MQGDGTRKLNIQLSFALEQILTTDSVTPTATSY